MRQFIILLLGLSYLAGCAPKNQTTDGTKIIETPSSYTLQEDKKSQPSFTKDAGRVLSVSKKYCGATKAISKVSKYCNFALSVIN